MYLTNRHEGNKILACSIDYFHVLFYFNHTMNEGRWDEKTLVFLPFMVVDHIDVFKEEMKWQEEQAG